MECKLRSVNFRTVSNPRRAFLPAFKVTGSAEEMPVSTDDNPGSTWECWREAWEHKRHDWEHLRSQLNSLEKITSSLGTLLVRVQIIATTYCSTISSSQFGFLSRYRYSYTSTQGISGPASDGV
jgi:hypothetical protein